MEKATFAAGCFWGVEESFANLKGVTKTTVGYEGGDFLNPTYEDVCSHKTGHAEVVQVEFDPAVISYAELLAHFFEIHNPTTLNRQGPDVGSQYRSAIFFHNDEQKRLAIEAKEKLNQSGKLKSPVVTEISQSATFYPAEQYHQRYLKKRGINVCHT
jgi:peptide-methionine (S)-S-oxide reductase